MLRRLDLIRVKGKSRPTWVYESLWHHTAETFPKLAPVITAYETGLDCYQRRDWKGGLRQFGEALELAPHDGSSGDGCNGAGIGIGGNLAVPPLPHHRAYGSRTTAVRPG